VALKEMSTVLDAEREALELESIPEYLSDSPLPSREAAVSMASKVFTERETRSEEAPVSPVAHKADELETLWPGLHHDLSAPARKSSSFYLTIGFMAGAFISMLGVFGYFSATQLVAHNGTGEHRVVVASVPGSKAQAAAPAAAVRTDAGGEAVVPASNQYQVQTGDTLAGIAQKNYKRVSPRLLDEICKVNNLRNANVLSLGQKLTLPEYHTQPAQVAGAGQIQ
jgi:LysM repeat protein